MMKLWMRKKRMTYLEIGRAELQARSGSSVRQGDTLVVYQGPDCRLYARERSEFEDGMFMPGPELSEVAVIVEMIDPELAEAKADGRYDAPESLWYIRERYATLKAEAIIAFMRGQR